MYSEICHKMISKSMKATYNIRLFLDTTRCITEIKAKALSIVE